VKCEKRATEEKEVIQSCMLEMEQEECEEFADIEEEAEEDDCSPVL
jgi:hypothetical protein